MADDSMALLETLRKVTADGDVDVLREGVRVLAQAIMEAEVTELTGVAKGERDPERRLTHRNGYRDRRWDTRVGTIELDVPKVRDGSYLPSLLEPRRRAERALLAVVQEAYVSGVSTRRVDDLVRALGIDGDQQERGEPDLRRARRRGRARSGRRPLGELACPVRLARRDVPQGPRGRPGRVDGGPRRDRGRRDRRAPGARARGRQRRGRRVWPAFVRRLVERGLARGPPRHQRRPRGPGQGASHEQLLGAAWQRCRVHFTRNAQDLGPARPRRAWSPSAIRTIFEQPDALSPSGSSSTRVADSSPPGSPPSPRCSPRPSVTASPTSRSRAHWQPDPEHEPARAAQQGDPGVALVPAGRTATAARTVGDRAEA